MASRRVATSPAHFIDWPGDFKVGYVVDFVVDFVAQVKVDFENSTGIMPLTDFSYTWILKSTW